MNRYIIGMFLFVGALLIPSLNIYCQERINSYVISIYGQIADSSTGAFIPDVSIYLLKTGDLIESNEFGYFSIKIVPESNNTLLFVKEGYKKVELSMNFVRDTFLTILLDHVWLKEVEIFNDSNESAFISKDGSGGNVITEKKLNSLPLILGEKDVARSLQFLPGVLPNNEASTGINVRGGSADQNSYLIDDVPIYNINHLFGFVSAFNSDILKEAVFYKGDFPARFGDKLSSVCNIRTKDGNDKKIGGSFTVNPVSSKLFLEGPIIKEKLTYAFAIRRSFIDFFTSTILENLTDYDRYYFYDLNFKLKWSADRNNRFYLSSLNGKDSFSNSINNKGDTHDENTLGWKNLGFSLRWNRIFSSTLFSNVTLIFSDYNFVSDQKSYRDNVLEYAVKYQSKLRSISSKIDFDYYITNNYKLQFGGMFQSFNINPGVLQQQVDSSQTEIAYSYKPYQSSIYQESIFDISTKSHLNIGLRADFYYSDSHYVQLQPRIGFEYELSNLLTFHAGYFRSSQSMHQLSNTNIGVPTDLWVPSLNNLEPEVASLYVFGVKAKKEKKIMLTIDSYYKKMANIIDYKPGASFLSVSQDVSKNNFPDWTQNVTNGNGESYGAEILIEKINGRFTGWVSYTLSWAKRKFDEINFGNEFYAAADRRHDLVIILNYKPKRNEQRKNILEISGVWTFATANPVSLPSGKIIDVPFSTHGGNVLNKITTYNSYLRMQPYHRLDLALRLIRAKDGKRTWEVGVYNVYNRSNPYYYYLSENTSTNYHSQLSLMQRSYFSILPYLSYEIKF
jgi:hypothetical protein